MPLFKRSKDKPSSQATTNKKASKNAEMDYAATYFEELSKVYRFLLNVNLEKNDTYVASMNAELNELGKKITSGKNPRMQIEDLQSMIISELSVMDYSHTLPNDISSNLSNFMQAPSLTEDRWQELIRLLNDTITVYQSRATTPAAPLTRNRASADAPAYNPSATFSQSSRAGVDRDSSTTTSTLERTSSTSPNDPDTALESTSNTDLDSSSSNSSGWVKGSSRRP